MVRVQKIDQLLYESVSMKKQILIAFTAMNIWHSVKSFDISILTSQRLYNVQTKLSKRMPTRQSWILFTVFAIFSAIILIVTQRFQQYRRSVAWHRLTTAAKETTLHPSALLAYTKKKHTNKHFQEAISNKVIFSRSCQVCAFRGPWHSLTRELKAGPVKVPRGTTFLMFLELLFALRWGHNVWGLWGG